jgi:hypothetical protein
MIQSGIDGVRACQGLSTGPLLEGKLVDVAQKGDGAVDGASERRCGSAPGRDSDRGLAHNRPRCTAS